MVSLADKIQHLYPNSKSLVDWVCANAGAGDFIKFWSVALGPQPSQATLDAVTQADLDADAVAAALAGDAREPLLSGLRDQAALAIANNDAYLALPLAPTNAQVVAQVKALTQQQTRTMNALRRVILKLNVIS